MPRYSGRITAAVLALAIIITACQAFGVTNTRPNVVISAPPSGTQYNVGQDVAFTSTSTDPNGITRVELVVDGLIVRTDPSPVAQGQAQFQVIQTWKATSPGSHTVTIRAYNSAGVFGEGAVNVIVNSSVAGEATSVPTSQPSTSVPIPTNTTGPAVPTLPPPVATDTSVPSGCTANSVFVADVTIPDGTVLAPGAQFNKTWRVTNSGTCTWDTSYAIIWIGGSQIGLAAAAPISVATPGTTIDITIPMRAPASPGNYQSVWRLRDSSGNPFGTNLTAVIAVPNPNPPTPTRTPTPSGSGPIISSFTCSPCTISVGQTALLTWGLVTGATSVSIDQGIGGVGTPGNHPVSPSVTTTYTMTAVGPGGTTLRSVTVTLVGNFAGSWYHNFGTMSLSQSGASVTGTYYNALNAASGTVAGTVTGNSLDGSYSIGGTTGTIHWVLGGGGNQFTGAWNGTTKWCGARNGKQFPSNCSYAGSWITNISCTTPTMNLTRVDMTVSGTYCGTRTVSGTLSFSGGYAVLAGTWVVPPSTTGSFTFYLPGYDSPQFRGNYGPSNAWCGWRSGASAPGVCFQ